MKLGQPVPTLIGGEAQRLKLAAHLTQTFFFFFFFFFTAKRISRCKALLSFFFFDEPTTGLHSDDIARLLDAFNRLIDRGHSVIVIEHNLDVIRAAEWIIDLGPEGGDAGGAIVGVGTPARFGAKGNGMPGARCGGVSTSCPPFRLHMWSTKKAQVTGERAPAPMPSASTTRANITSRTSISASPASGLRSSPHCGSGKSTLAFDILFAEGQRRYLESLNAYARQFVQPASRPDVDAIFGIPPTVAIEQRTSRGGRKSTVATLTEIYHFLRLLYVKLGVQHCPDCESRSNRSPPTPSPRGCSRTTAAAITLRRRSSWPARDCTRPRKMGARKGFAHLRVDGKLLPTAKWPRLDRFTEHNIELPVPRSTSAAQARRSCAGRWRRRWNMAAAWCTSDGREPGRRRERVLDQTRLSEMRHGLSRTRPPAVLVQLEARLVQRLLRYRT